MTSYSRSSWFRIRKKIFVLQLYLVVPSTNSLKSTHYFIIKIPKKLYIQQVAFNHSSDILFYEFMKIHQLILMKHIFFRQWYYCFIRWCFIIYKESNKIYIYIYIKKSLWLLMKELKTKNFNMFIMIIIGKQ